MPTKSVTTKDILSLLHRQGFHCAYTGEQLTPENAGADHKIPVGRGGSNQIENIAIVKREVNSAKGAMTVEEFVEMCRKVAAYFSDGKLSQAAIPFPEVASGVPPHADASEILMRLGYLDAAENVHKMREKLKRMEAYHRGQGGRRLSFEEYTEERVQEIAKLNEQIAALRVTRAQLRAKTGTVL